MEDGLKGERGAGANLTWWIRAAVGEEDGESVNAGEYDEEPESKGEDDGPPLELSELQLQHVGNWKDQDGNVGNDGRSSVCGPCANLIGTMSGKCGVPNLLDWDADEEEDEDDGNDPSNDKGPDDVCPNSEGWESKDAVVEEEEG